MGGWMRSMLRIAIVTVFRLVMLTSLILNGSLRTSV
jgi:hypothetical protein